MQFEQSEDGNFAESADPLLSPLVNCPCTLNDEDFKRIIAPSEEKKEFDYFLLNT